MLCDNLEGWDEGWWEGGSEAPNPPPPTIITLLSITPSPTFLHSNLPNAPFNILSFPTPEKAVKSGYS